MYYEQQEMRLFAYNSLVGTTYTIRVHKRSEKLNQNGEISDEDAEDIVKDELEGACVDVKLAETPTLCNIARYICERVPFAYKVSVQCGNKTGVYVKD